MCAVVDMKPGQWERMKKENNWNEIELRDGRYNQVIHMVSAAKGAEAFYHIENHTSRHEGVELARHLDDLTSQVIIDFKEACSSPIVVDLNGIFRCFSLEVVN